MVRNHVLAPDPLGQAVQDAGPDKQNDGKSSPTLRTEAKKLEQETGHERQRADRYDLGEVLLEVALVVTSITLLSGRRTFWHAGIVLTVVGLIVASTALLVH